MTTQQNETPRLIAESRNEVARRIAGRFLADYLNQPELAKLEALAGNIEAALKDRDERGVEIVNRFSICRDHDQPTHCVQCDLRHKAIAAIRGKD